MKYIYKVLLFLFATHSILAQAPESMNYQAVLRDASNALLTNQEVSMQISILRGASTGTALYTETQTATTNLNGLVILAIGTGSTSGNFATIDWSAGPYFIKTATDPSGGSSYTITGTSQIMSVPFAMHAKTSGNSETNATNIANNTIDIATNTSAIATNTAKVGYTDALVSANTDVADNTDKVGITSDQANAITANTTKIAAAGELTGTSLNATVVGSSLTSVGTLTGLTVTGTTETGSVKITGGTPGQGKVLTSDENGLASWQAVVTRDVADEFLANPDQIAFTLSQIPHENSKVKMYVNGIRISKTAYDYNHSGSTLTYDSAKNGGYALTEGDRIQFDYFY